MIQASFPLFILAAAASSFSGAPVGAEGWTDLPKGFFAPGSGRFRLEVGARALPLDLSSDPDWSEDGLYEETPAPRLELRFRRMADGQSGSATVLLLSDAAADPITVRMEVSFRGLESALPARLTPRGSGDVVLLGLGSSGAGSATGLRDPATGRSVDLGGIHPSFSIALESSSSGSGSRFAIQGRIPRGKEVAFFAWRLIEPGLSRESLPSAKVDQLAASFHGWSLPGGSSLADRAEKLLQASPIPRGSYLEIGDGWQGKRGGKLFGKPDRSWLPSTLAASPDGATPPAEIARQLERLRGLDFKAGLWIIPHGQSEEDVFRRSPEAFVRDRKGNPISGGFLGSYVVDGTSRAGIAYLIELFRNLRAFGAPVFRIGGLRDALAFYKQEHANLAVPGADAAQVLRDTVQAMRDGCGEGIVLAGDWDTPDLLAGLLDSTRPSVPETGSAELLLQEGAAAARGYFRHRGPWLVECFPVTSWAEGSNEAERRDVDQSRLLFAALTGRGVVVDRSVTLPVWAPLLLRSASPPVAVRPIDLFPSEALPRVWSLKLPGGGDLAGIFNWTSLASASVRLSPRDLGAAVPEGQSYLYFDVLDESFAGASPGERDFFLLPGRSRLVAIHPDLGRPQLVAVSGPFLATASLVKEFSWDAVRREIRGRATLPSVEERGAELRLHIACGARDAVIAASALGGTCQFSLEEGHLTLTLGGPSGAALPFRVAFAGTSLAAPALPAAHAPPRDLRVALEESERRPLLEWKAANSGIEWWRGARGFAVFRDGTEIGRTTDSKFLDAAVVPGERIQYSVTALPSGAACAPVVFTFPTRKDVHLDDWVPRGFAPESSPPAKRRSVVGGPLAVGGKKFAHGLGMRAPSQVEYRLDGAYSSFEAVVGVDDAARFQGSVELVVKADGIEKYRSPILRGGGVDPKPVSVPIVGAQVLSLIVEDAGDGADGDLADWGDARLVK